MSAAADRRLSPVCAFDIAADGSARAVDDPWPSAEPGEGASYRWVHCDLADPAFDGWARDSLPAIAAMALIQDETRPRCDRHMDGILLNLRGVNLNPGAEADDMVSLRAWVTPTLVVSARKRRVYAIDAIRVRALEDDAPPGVGAFLADLTKGLVDRIETVSLALEDETDDLEDRMYEAPREISAAVTPLRHSIIKLRRFVGPQREAMLRLAVLDPPLAAETDRTLLHEIGNRATRIVEELDANRDRLTAMRDHIEAQHAASMSRNNYVLSVVAAIFLPLGFLTGLFGVNVGGMPGVDWAWAFALLTVAMVLIGVGLFVVFRLAKWL